MTNLEKGIELQSLKEISDNIPLSPRNSTDHIRTNLINIGQTKSDQKPFRSASADSIDSLNKDNPSLTLSEILGYAKSFYLAIIPLILNRMYNNFFITMCIFLYSYYLDSKLAAGFGFGIAVYSVLWYDIVQINGEIGGILISKSFGAKDFKQMRLNFQRCLLIN